ncbi:cupin domain-containing protein [Parafrankia discariae]|uniref:cupin domain-containing protein n=1 Tax=Parafrankia discariae TaxID=365528 RepID=UPI00035CCF55|nr:cupin domain-containing protein [Parafrankia discariae]
MAHGERLAPGVTVTRLEPGGANGPDDVVLSDVVGGLTWQDLWYLGSDDDDFRMCIPDVRMPANQIWPLHWHDDWMFITVLDGSVLVGDWLMRPGDVLVTAPNVEYGPLVNGPRGCQLLEVFARNRKGGGYAPEYHDHPTLRGPGRVMYRPGIYKYGPAGVFNFSARPSGSEANEGNQTMTIDGTPGLFKGSLTGGGRWELGESDDPDRGIALSTNLAPGGKIPSHRLLDWRWSLVIGGGLTLGSRRLNVGDIVIAESESAIPEAEAGTAGARLLEFGRTVRSETRLFD